MEYLEAPVFPLHRLDVPTSGVLLFAKSRQAATLVGQLFQQRLVEKTYVALVQGQTPEEFKVKNYLKLQKIKGVQKSTVVKSGGDPAETHFRRLSWRSQGQCSLVECHPLTGRTHQIRVHLASRGFPILGDELYGDKASAKRLMLHALRLKLLSDDPAFQIEVSAPLPAEFSL